MQILPLEMERIYHDNHPRTQPSPSIIDALWEISRRLPLSLRQNQRLRFLPFLLTILQLQIIIRKCQRQNEINYGPLGPPPNDVIEEAVGMESIILPVAAPIAEGLIHSAASGVFAPLLQEWEYAVNRTFPNLGPTESQAIEGWLKTGLTWQVWSNAWRQRGIDAGFERRDSNEYCQKVLPLQLTCHMLCGGVTSKRNRRRRLFPTY